MGGGRRAIALRPRGTSFRGLSCASGAPVARGFCLRGVAVPTDQSTALGLLPVHLDGVAAAVAVARLACDFIAVAHRSILVPEPVVREAPLVSAGLLLVQGGVGTGSLGLGRRDP